MTTWILRRHRETIRGIATWRFNGYTLAALHGHIREWHCYEYKTYTTSRPDTISSILKIVMLWAHAGLNCGRNSILLSSKDVFVSAKLRFVALRASCRIDTCRQIGTRVQTFPDALLRAPLRAGSLLMKLSTSCRLIQINQTARTMNVKGSVTAQYTQKWLLTV